MRETTRENETKVQQISKKVTSIDERLTRMEEYTIQILDMLANVNGPLPSPAEEREDAMSETSSLNIEYRDQDEFSPRVGPKRMFSRMMSVPAYVHRQQASSSLRPTPMYFRHKLPNSNPYPPWYRQLSKSNWHRSSLEKAIRKFKRSVTLPSLDEVSKGSGGKAEKGKMEAHVPFAQVSSRMPL